MNASSFHLFFTALVWVVSPSLVSPASLSGPRHVILALLSPIPISYHFTLLQGNHILDRVL
jgi:hypothetical protein